MCTISIYYSVASDVSVTLLLYFHSHKLVVPNTLSLVTLTFDDANL